MRLPEFTSSGDLPPGVYQASLTEVLARFGESSESRKRVGKRLSRIHRIAVETGNLSRFVVFGSFVTLNPAPNDVDVFMIMDDRFDYATLHGEARLLFEHGSAQNHFGASVFWIRRLAALDGESAALEYWQVKRDGMLRGIVEIAEVQA